MVQAFSSAALVVVAAINVLFSLVAPVIVAIIILLRFVDPSFTQIEFYSIHLGRQSGSRNLQFTPFAPIDGSSLKTTSITSSNE